jgi:3-oxoacyl-[acyl-carrier protein] reductase
VIGWLKTLAQEVAADGVTVNTILPGRIDTERMRELYGPDGPPPEVLAAIPAGRLGRPREVGDVICFLASERASYVSGAAIPVDGGAARGLL